MRCSSVGDFGECGGSDRERGGGDAMMYCCALVGAAGVNGTVGVRAGLLCELRALGLAGGVAAVLPWKSALGLWYELSLLLGDLDASWGLGASGVGIGSPSSWRR